MTKAEIELAMLKSHLRFMADHLDLSTDIIIRLGSDPKGTAVRLSREAAADARRAAQNEPVNQETSTMKEPAHVAYDAYAAFTGGKTFDGRDMPKWDELPDRIKDAWRAAIAAVSPTE